MRLGYKSNSIPRLTTLVVCPRLLFYERVARRGVAWRGVARVVAAEARSRGHTTSLAGAREMFVRMNVAREGSSGVAQLHRSILAPRTSPRRDDHVMFSEVITTI